MANPSLMEAYKREICRTYVVSWEDLANGAELKRMSEAHELLVYVLMEDCGLSRVAIARLLHRGIGSIESIEKSGRDHVAKSMGLRLILEDVRMIVQRPPGELIATSEPPRKRTPLEQYWAIRAVQKAHQRRIGYVREDTL